LIHHQIQNRTDFLSFFFLNLFLELDLVQISSHIDLLTLQALMRFLQEQEELQGQLKQLGQELMVGQGLMIV